MKVKTFLILSSRSNNSVTRPSVIVRATDPNADSNINRKSTQIAFASLIDDEMDSETDARPAVIEGTSAGNFSFGDNDATVETSSQSDLNSARFGLP